jgi:hypothetical protein
MARRRAPDESQRAAVAVEQGTAKWQLSLARRPMKVTSKELELSSSLQQKHHQRRTQVSSKEHEAVARVLKRKMKLRFPRAPRILGVLASICVAPPAGQVCHPMLLLL